MAFLGVALVALCRTTEAEPTTVQPRWYDSYAEALEVARREGRPVLVYFPPIAGRTTSRALAGVLDALRAPLARVPSEAGVLVRVSSAEVAKLKEAFAVAKLPALVLVDARENVRARFSGKLPAGLRAELRKLLRRLKREEVAAQRVIDAALGLLEDGKTAEAYGRIDALLRGKRTPYRPLEKARQIDQRVRRIQEVEVLQILAAEGLVPDKALRQRLEKLRAKTLHPQVAALVKRELELLKLQL